ncbi:MAG: hypothetical protein HYY50_00305 [Candidatus Kerfeldbacteria bacterium]|nr:hypothetical protein [Candidatus Kerfeldbacteria bacterium]
MNQSTDEFKVFRLEKFIPTHCPKCAHPFRSNADRDFLFDHRLLHPQETPAEWLAVFPEAAATEGLHAEPIWCGRCQNITLRVVTAVRHVTTEAEAVELESLGYANRRVLECSGESFSQLPEYTLAVLVDPETERGPITFFPKAMHRPGPPRPSQ